MILDRPTRIDKIRRAFLEQFTIGMNSIKPTNPRDPNYADQYKAWQMAFEFPKRLNFYVLDLANTLVLAGKPNQNIPENEIIVTREFTDDLISVLNSDEFDKYMEIAKPNLPDDPDRDEKIEKWEEAFTFARILRYWANDLAIVIDYHGGKIHGPGYNAQIYFLIRKLGQ